MSSSSESFLDKYFPFFVLAFLLVFLFWLWLTYPYSDYLRVHSLNPTEAVVVANEYNGVPVYQFAHDGDNGHLAEKQIQRQYYQYHEKLEVGQKVKIFIDPSGQIVFERERNWLLTSFIFYSVVMFVTPIVLPMLLYEKKPKNKSKKKKI